MYFVKTPLFLQYLFNCFIWKIKSNNKEVFLTFDDGPIPVVTELILDILKRQQVKATFFCVGENIQKHPNIYKRILQEGHQTGNHTFNHLNGWKTTQKIYTENVMKAQKLIQSNLFRPPYGKIKLKQAKWLMQNGFKIVMWSVLSGDFNKNSSAETCYNNVIKNTESGSILVFHDNLKSKNNTEQILEKTIITLKQKGFRFKLL